jgi:hypothetical protein
MCETFNAETFRKELLSEQQSLPVSYGTDTIVADTPSVLRETTAHARVTPKALEEEFIKLVDSGRIPKGGENECFRITVANGHEFQTIIYDPRTGDPIGFVTATSTVEELRFAMLMSVSMDEQIPPTYASQIIIIGQSRNDAVATSALQFTYEYAAMHTVNGKILLKEWATASGQDDYRDEQIFLNLIDDNGTLYHQPKGDTYQGMISRAPELSGNEAFILTDFLCLPQKALVELILAGYTLSDEILTIDDIPVATLTHDQGWQFTPEASYFDMCFINQLSRLALLEPTSFIDDNLDLVLHNERGQEIIRAPGKSPVEIELKTTEKTSIVVWASPTLTDAEREMFTTITATGEIIPPYIHGDYGHINDPSYFARATKIIDPNRPEIEYIASAFLVLNENGNFVAYDPEKKPLNVWVTERNKRRKTDHYPILSGAGFDRRANVTAVEVVEPMGAYSLEEATDKVNFTTRMRAILPGFIILPEYKAITQVTLPNGDVVYQQLYQRPRSISLDSIAAAALSHRTIRRLHSTRVMQTAIALREMIANDTIHLSLHAGNRQISLINGLMRVYIGDWDEIIALSSWSNKKFDKKVSGFAGNPLSFNSSENSKNEELLRNYSNNVGLTPRQIVIMHGLQRFLFTEMVGSLRMMSIEKVPAIKAINTVLNNTIDMLILAFAKNTEQRAQYGRYREKLIDEVLKLSPDGTIVPDANGPSPLAFLPIAIAIVITKWFYPADNELMSPGDPIGVSPARYSTSQQPSSGSRPVLLNQLRNKTTLQRLRRR